MYTYSTVFIVTLVLLATLWCGPVAGAATMRNVTILNQSNGRQTSLDLVNVLMCQNMTDKWGFPVLKAADDMVLPDRDYFAARGIPGGLSDCSALWFTVSTIRRKNDLNPASVTLELMRHNETTQRPSEGAPFYRKTLPWPTNNYLWLSDPLNRPWDSSFRLELNELGDDGVTRFNFRDPQFIPPRTTIWFSFYATLSLHQDQRYMANIMYWATLTNGSGSTPVQPVFGTDGTTGSTTIKNHDFVYRDEHDFLQQGWTQWTTAVPVEEEMMIAPTTNNMAWRVSFECLQDLSLVTVAPTGPPLAPTNSSMAPLDMSGWNETINGTDPVARQHSDFHILWIIAVPVTLILAAIGVGYIVWRQRRKPPFKGGGARRREQAREAREAHGSETAEDVLLSLREGDSQVRLSEASLFEEMDSVPTARPAPTYYYPYSGSGGAASALANGRNGPVVMSPISVTTYDRNNPFSRQQTDLMMVSISDDQED